MRPIAKFLMTATLLLAATVAMSATDDDYRDTVNLFKHAGESAEFFHDCYGYAVFPTIGKGAFVVGNAYGIGRVYEHSRYFGDTSLAQVSILFQAGGEGYRQIVFLEDKRAIDELT